MDKKGTPWFIAVMLLLLFTGCKKDGAPPIPQLPPPPPSPLLIAVDYNDNFPTELHNTLQYDMDRRLQQIRTTYSTGGGAIQGFYRRYTWTGKQVQTKEFALDDTAIPNSDATFQLTLNNFKGAYFNTMFDFTSNSYAEYKTQFSYYEDTYYLEQVATYKSANTELFNMFEYHYSGNNRLDSISGYRISNNILQKFQVVIFEYDVNNKNTIGNSWMSFNMDDALNLGGNSQRNALSKETLYYYNFNSTHPRLLVEEDSYTNQSDNKGLLISRSLVSKYYATDGSVADLTTATYKYTYQ